MDNNKTASKSGRGIEFSDYTLKPFWKFFELKILRNNNKKEQVCSYQDEAF